MDNNEAADKPHNNGIRNIVWAVAGITAVLAPLLTRTALVNNYQSKAGERAASAYQAYYKSMGKQYYDTNHCTTKAADLWFWQKDDCTPHYVDETGTYISPYEIQQEMWEEQQNAMNEQYEYQQQQYDENGGQYYQNQGQYNQQAQYNNGQNMQYYQNQYPQYGNQGVNTSVKDQAPWLKALYSIEVLAFVGILGHGWKVLSNSKNASRLSDMLVALLAFNVVTIVWLRALTIETDDYETQLTGYYGQFSVLMFMTNVSLGVFTLIAAYYFRRVYVSAEPDPDEAAEHYVEAPAENAVV
jgi:uncharacterized membrane protein